MMQLGRPLLIVGPIAALLWMGSSVGRGPGDPAGTPDARAVIDGVEIVAVTAGGAGEGFGLRVGDRLVGWRDGAGHGALGTPLDAYRLEAERAPHGGVELVVWRGEEQLLLPVSSGLWEVELGAIGPAGQGDGETPWTRYLAGRDLAAAGELDSARTAFAARGVVAQGVDALLLELEGLAWHEAGQRELAIDALHRAIERYRQEAPNSVALARSIFRTLEILPRSERSPWLAEAQAILDARAPASLLRAEILFHRGVLDAEASRFDEAEARYLEALALQQKIASATHRTARTMFCLGRLRARQGRLDEAERWMGQALAMVPPEREAQIAGINNSLALVLRDKGDLTRARDTTMRALDGFRRLDPDSMAVAGALNNLATLHLRLEAFDQAEATYHEALDLMRRIAPESRFVGGLLHNLGRVAQQRRDFTAARRFLLEGLEHKRRLAPRSETVANSLLGLGELSYEEGRLDEAEQWTREALALRESIAPTALRCAETRILLGMILADAERFDEAEAIWRDGLAALDQANESFRYTAQERSLFTSRFQEHYRNLAAHYIHRGRPVDAFDLLERSRARALRTFVDRRPDDAQRGDALSTSRSVIVEALDLSAVRHALDAGTRLVVFSVGEHETSLMVVADASRGGDGVVVETVPIGEDALRRQVELFRSLIERGQIQPRIEHALVHHGRRLYDQLLAPIADELDSASRLVLVPDGPLHTLPFTALVRSDEPIRWVAEWKPITLAVSATVFVDAKARRPTADEPPRLAIYAQSRVAGERLSGITSEARRIADQAGARARVWFDRHASEASLKALLRHDADTVDILHLATHATVDRRSPLDSAIHLAAGDGEDGLLQAHEIIDQLELSSDLVVLSACSTGQGRTLASDGVLGLSHAFLFAGARTLITSLWPVADPSTAEWMGTFYDHLDRGFDRDRALQEAQRVGIAAGAHPVHWAAFQLWGDWDDRRSAGPVAINRIAAASEAEILALRRR